MAEEPFNLKKFYIVRRAAQISNPLFPHPPNRHHSYLPLHPLVASDRSDLKPPWLTASGQTAILLDCLTAPNRLGSQSRAPPECSEGQDHARRNRGGRVGSRKPRPSGGHIGFSNMNREQKQSMKLEDLQANAAVHGILSDSLVTVVSVQWFGSEALELTVPKNLPVLSHRKHIQRSSLKRPAKCKPSTGGPVRFRQRLPFQPVVRSVVPHRAAGAGAVRWT